jgi:DNA (cytosine-5)-methyltransferase 1
MIRRAITVRNRGEKAGFQLHLPLKGSTSEMTWNLREVRTRRSHTVAGLFAGIGGIELGLERAGHRTALLCENDPCAIAVLRAHFLSQGRTRFSEDIVRLKNLPEDVSLVTAGFPCQDLSQAGATRGISGARSGLVGEVFRLIQDRRVPWVLLENVPFMLQLAGGEAMNVITTALEELGYRWAYRTIDSRAFGLPQRRRRVYLIATNEGDPRAVLFGDEAGTPEEFDRDPASVACGFYWTEGLRGLGWAVDAVPTLKGGSAIGIPSPPAVLLSNRRVVTPDIVDAERLQGFRGQWTKPAETVGRPSSRWKLVGNAVNVRAAEWIGRRLAKPRKLLDFETFKMTSNRRWPNAAWNVGEGRTEISASEWPVRRAYLSLEKFLRPQTLKPLSLKATSGFLSRARIAKLRFAPGFIEALEDHERGMRDISAPKGKASASRP